METCKTENTKVGDIIYSLKDDKIIEWEIISINPKNNRLFIVIDADGNITQVHWKVLEYGTDCINYFSLSKDDLVNRYKEHTHNTLIKISYLD